MLIFSWKTYNPGTVFFDQEVFNLIKFIWQNRQSVTIEKGDENWDNGGINIKISPLGRIFLAGSSENDC